MRPGKLKKEPYNVIISGVGGQGNVLLSGFIGAALVNEGFVVSVADTFGVSQRGGSVSSHIKISERLSTARSPSRARRMCSSAWNR